MREKARKLYFSIEKHGVYVINIFIIYNLLENNQNKFFKILN